MRVTNGMMRTNAMLNMQKNKIAYDKYLQQYNTQKKIQRPSDDPTIAVRALKYRTTLNEIEQYQRNIEDATSWMDATETAIKDVDKVMDNMVQYVTQAATGTVNAKDRADINKQLDQYAQYIYEQDMNADYAGRYLFTGFRTDSALLFDKAQDNVIYTIHEPLEVSDIRQYSYVYGRAEYETEEIFTRRWKLPVMTIRLRQRLLYRPMSTQRKHRSSRPPTGFSCPTRICVITRQTPTRSWRTTRTTGFDI